MNLCVRFALKPLRTPLDFCRLFSKSTSESVSESSLAREVFLLTEKKNRYFRETFNVKDRRTHMMAFHRLVCAARRTFVVFSAESAENWWSWLS